jgi:hypothetical protein
MQRSIEASSPTLDMYYEWTHVLLVCRRFRAIAVHGTALLNVLCFSSDRVRHGELCRYAAVCHRSTHRRRLDSQ